MLRRSLAYGHLWELLFKSVLFYIYTYCFTLHLHIGLQCTVYPQFTNVTNQPLPTTSQHSEPVTVSEAHQNDRRLFQTESEMYKFMQCAIKFTQTEHN